jgi:hypothetical protein
VIFEVKNCPEVPILLSERVGWFERQGKTSILSAGRAEKAIRIRGTARPSSRTDAFGSSSAINCYWWRSTGSPVLLLLPFNSKRTHSKTRIPTDGINETHITPLSTSKTSTLVVRIAPKAVQILPITNRLNLDNRRERIVGHIIPKSAVVIKAGQTRTNLLQIGTRNSRAVLKANDAKVITRFYFLHDKAVYDHTNRVHLPVQQLPRPSEHSYPSLFTYLSTYLPSYPTK